MVTEPPMVSIVIPTYNAERTISRCLKSIFQQEYEHALEIIIVDGGSKDKTVEIAKKLRVSKILHNPFIGQEMGKVIGIDNAEGEFIALIDSDNVLPETGWLRKMVKPIFENEDITGSEPIMFSYRPSDPQISRYCALIGCDDPLCYIIGNRDKWSWIKMNWTDIPVDSVDQGDYLIVKFNKNERVPTMGANGFIVKKEALRKVKYSPYIDVDVFYNLIQEGYNKYAKVKTSIIHLHANGLNQFIKKKYRRVQIHNAFKKYRTYSWNLTKNDIMKIISRTTIFSLTQESIQGYRNMPDKAWFIHPIACLMTILTYAIANMIHVWKMPRKVR